MQLAIFRVVKRARILNFNCKLQAGLHSTQLIPSPSYIDALIFGLMKSYYSHFIALFSIFRFSSTRRLILPRCELLQVDGEIFENLPIEGNSDLLLVQVNQEMQCQNVCD